MTEDQIIETLSFAPVSRQHDNNGEFYQEAVADIYEHVRRINELEGIAKALDLGAAIFEYNCAVVGKDDSADHIKSAAIIDAHIAIQGVINRGFCVDYQEANRRIWKFISQDAGRACTNEYDGAIPASSLLPGQLDDYKVAQAFISNVVCSIVN
jgi:hypothetical protein